MYPLPVILCIPARSQSARFPNKLNKFLGGKTVLQRTIENCLKSKICGERVVLMGDGSGITENHKNDKLMGAWNIADGETIKCGTQRIYECMRVGGANVSPETIVVNVQADECMLPWPWIDALVAFLREKTDYGIATIGCRLRERRAGDVLVDGFDGGPAINFRRADREQWPVEGGTHSHVGVYAFRYKTLMEQGWRYDRESEITSLEQLSWRTPIALCVFENDKPISINHPEDLEEAAKHLPVVEKEGDYPAGGKQ